MEFRENRELLGSNPLTVNGEVLLLAGDIIPFVLIKKQKDFFNFVSDNFKYTYWIPGNHEYYHSDIMQKTGTFNENIKSNVLLVNNTSVILDNMKFIFTTLWTKIRPAYQWQIERGMSDFQAIHYNGHRFSAEKFNSLHEESLAFINKELNKDKSERTIVVTHHVPTFMNYPEKYKGDVLNDAFAVELSGLIESKGPDYWIYGHHHHNIPDFKINKTVLVTNQLGYVEYGEQVNFNNDRIINL